MSFEITEDEMREAMRNGRAKIVAKPPAKTEPKGPSDADRIVAAIRTLAERPVTKAPDVAVAAPHVSVAAPKVTVQAPAVNIPEQPRAWVVEVLERDGYDLIKKMKFTAT